MEHCRTIIAIWVYHRFFYGYSIQQLSMQHNPFSPRNNIQYQREEVPSYGCCFSPLYTEVREYQNPKPERFRFHSEPREPKTKKLELVTPKRGLSNSKQTYLSTQRTSIKDKSSPQTKNGSKEKEHQKLSLTLGSKVASVRTSRATSKVSFNKDVGVGNKPVQIRQSWMTTRNTTKPLPTEANNPVNDNQTSIAFISDISFVEEQFISQGSETLQALNFIAQLKSGDNKSAQQQGNKASHFGAERGDRNREQMNPFCRKMEDCRIKAGGRKKLIL